MNDISRRVRSAGGRPPATKSVPSGARTDSKVHDNASTVAPAPLPDEAVKLTAVPVAEAASMRHSREHNDTTGEPGGGWCYSGTSETSGCRAGHAAETTSATAPCKDAKRRIHHD